MLIFHLPIRVQYRKYKCFKFASLFLLLFTTACAATPAVSQSPNTPDAVQAYVDANASQATAVAAVATAQYFTAGLTATADAHDQSATQQAFNLQATQQAENISSTQQAWNATSTSSSAQATQSASGTTTASAAQAIWTAQAIDVTSTAAQASVQAYATEQYSNARTDELTLQRRELMNNVEAVTPWAAFGISFIAAILFVFRWTRVRVIQRDERGDAPLLLNTIDGIAYDADRHPLSTAGLLRNDLQRLPQLSAENHTLTTAHDQMLDLATRLPNSPRLQEKLTAAIASSDPKSTPQVQVIPEEQAKLWLKDVLPHLLQDAIEGEIISDEGDKRS